METNIRDNKGNLIWENTDKEEVFLLRQRQLAKWDREVIWKGWFILAVVVSLGMFML